MTQLQERFIQAKKTAQEKYNAEELLFIETLKILKPQGWEKLYQSVKDGNILALEHLLEFITSFKDLPIITDPTISEKGYAKLTNLTNLYVKNGNFECLKTLHDKFPDLLKEVAPNRIKLIHIAAKYNQIEIFEYIFKHTKSKPEMTDQNGNSLLSLSIEGGYSEIFMEKLKILMFNNRDFGIKNTEEYLAGPAWIQKDYIDAIKEFINTKRKPSKDFLKTLEDSLESYTQFPHDEDVKEVLESLIYDCKKHLKMVEDAPDSKGKEAIKDAINDKKRKASNLDDSGFASKSMRLLGKDVLSDETDNSSETDMSMMGNDFCHYPIQ